MKLKVGRRYKDGYGNIVTITDTSRKDFTGQINRADYEEDYSKKGKRLTGRYDSDQGDLLYEVDDQDRPMKKRELAKRLDILEKYIDSLKQEGVLPR